MYNIYRTGMQIPVISSFAYFILTVSKKLLIQWYSSVLWIRILIRMDPRIRIKLKGKIRYGSTSKWQARSGSGSICRWQAKVYGIGMSLLEHVFKVLSHYLEARIRIRIRINMKVRIQIHINVIRIRNSDYSYFHFTSHLCLIFANPPFEGPHTLPPSGVVGGKNPSLTNTQSTQPLTLS
jgi:hypothetical protein